MKFTKIEFGGKTRTIRFGLKTLGDSIKHYDQDPGLFMKALEQNPFEAVPIMFFYGLKYGAEREGEIVDFELGDIYDWIEDLEKGLQDPVVETVTQMYIKSLYDNVPAVKEAIDSLDEDVKKSLIGT